MGIDIFMLRFVPNIFDKQEHWLSFRDRTWFRSEADLRAFQTARRQYICGVHGIDWSAAPVIEKLPDFRPDVPYVSLVRSGVTSSRLSDRIYRYSIPHQQIIEYHHIWKIEKSHNLLQPGNVIWVCSRPRPHFIDQFCHHPLCSVLGPKHLYSCGQQNTVYMLFYDATFSKEAWEYNLELARSLNPKWFRCSASTIQVMHYYASHFRFSCPVISSEETLTDTIRSNGESMFTRVIDKMLCWDGGLGWFECNVGRRHIYDELAYVEMADTYAVTTDLNNEAMAFIRYRVNDVGVVGRGKCSCGLFSNYFETFDGKHIEGLLIGNNLMSGRYVSELVSSLLRGSPKVAGFVIPEHQEFERASVLYRMHQQSNQQIRFFYASNEEIPINALDRFLRQLLGCDLMITYHRESVSDFLWNGRTGRKSLTIRSDVLKVAT